LKEKQVYLHDEVQFIFPLWTPAGDIQFIVESAALHHKSSERK
jgi:hypothetical protein